MVLKCLAIDDEPLALDLMREYISRCPNLKLVQTFEDAISAVEFLNHTYVDLIFVDIRMPDISGIDLVRALKKKPMIIFTTAFKKFAFEGFELNALDYLLKPFDFNRFSEAVNKASEYFDYKQSSRESHKEYLFVYSEYRLVKISLQEIIYIESLDDYVKIHLNSDKPILSLMTLKKILEKLPGSQFKRIHRSYIVALSKVKSVLNRKVMLTSMVELPISDSYLDFLNLWKKS